MSAIELTPERYAAYLAHRQRMLTEEPQAFWSSPTDDIAQGVEAFTALMAREHNDLFVVIVDGVIAASAGIVRIEKAKGNHRAKIWGVYCAPEHRGHGHGREAVRACVERARTWEGVDIVALSVSVSGAAALRVYESLGFVQWGTEPDVLRTGGQSYDEHHLALCL